MIKHIIYGRKIGLNDHYCSLNGMPASIVESPYINLYVQTKGCNANCLFCEYKDSANSFDMNLFKKFISSIGKEINVRKISFTGGEPTLKFEQFIEMVTLAKEYLPNTFFVVNTNGINLTKIYESKIYNLLDSIAISRHHYDDNINDNILSFNTPTTNELSKFIQNVGKNKVHFSCNIMKGYIDSDEKIRSYLEWIDEIGANDVGFVGLMFINAYSKERFIDFEKDIFLWSLRLNLTKRWNTKGCSCNNYLYIANSANIIMVYNRHAYSKAINNNFVFDGIYFRKGFNGKIISYE